MATQSLIDKVTGHSLGLAYLTDIVAGGGVSQVDAGIGISVNSANPIAPIVSANISSGAGINLVPPLAPSTQIQIVNTGVIGVNGSADIDVNTANPQQPIIELGPSIPRTLIAGPNIAINNANPQQPIITYVGPVGGGVASVVAGTDIAVNNTDPANPIINYVGGGGGGVTSVSAGTNISVGGTPSVPVVNVVPNYEMPTGGYVGVAPATLPAVLPLVDCVRFYKDAGRTLFTALLTAPIPPPPIGGGDSLVVVNESKDYDALACGNIKVFKQGDNYDTDVAFLHMGAVGVAGNYGIAYNDPNQPPPEVLFMDTNVGPPTTFNLYNIANANGAVYFIPQYISCSSILKQTNTTPTGNLLTYDTNDFQSLDPATGNPMMIFDPSNPSHIVNKYLGGRFRVITSIQWQTTSGGVQVINLWLVVNGVPVPRTGYFTSVPNNGEVLTTCENIVDIPANGYVEVVWYSTDPNMTAYYAPPTPPMPVDAPSAITIVQRIA